MAAGALLPGGYRVPPPSAAARVRWPDALGTRFVVCVDTEEEFDWSAPLTRDRHTLETLPALAPAQARFAAQGVPLAFMVDYPVVADPRGAEIVQALADAGGTIGTQLHGWVNPPLDEPLTAATSFVGNLAPALEAAKLDVLTAALEQVTGRAPRSYRAGRYGVGPATLDLLAARGYRLDSSMRAAHQYLGEGGPDFRAIGNHAFRTGPAGAIVELPLTTVFTGFARAGGTRLYDRLGTIPRGRGLFARTRLLNRVPLTPEGVPIAEACEAVRVGVGEGVRVLNFAFHSPSLVPGHTPYVRDAADLARFEQWWGTMLTLLDQLGVAAIGLDALIDAVPAA